MSGTYNGSLDQISESERGCAAPEWADFQGLIATNGQKIQHLTTAWILGKPQKSLMTLLGRGGGKGGKDFFMILKKICHFFISSKWASIQKKIKKLFFCSVVERNCLTYVKLRGWLATIFP